MKETGDGAVSGWFLLAIFAFLMIAILCGGCGAARPRPACSTRCGLNLLDPVPLIDKTHAGEHEWSCAEFQRAEDLSLAAYKSVSDPRFRDACAALNGWNVYVKPDLVWVDFANGDVSGMTYCYAGLSQVGNLPPVRSTLVHELAHAIQQCAARPPFEGEMPMHENWGRDGIWNAISTVQAIGKADCDGGCR